MGFCHLAQLSDIALSGPVTYIFRHEAGFCPVAADEPNPCTVKGFSKTILRRCAVNCVMAAWWLFDDCLMNVWWLPEWWLCNFVWWLRSDLMIAWWLCVDHVMTVRWPSLFNVIQRRTDFSKHFDIESKFNSVDLNFKFLFFCLLGRAFFPD